MLINYEIIRCSDVFQWEPSQKCVIVLCLGVRSSLGGAGGHIPQTSHWSRPKKMMEHLREWLDIFGGTSASSQVLVLVVRLVT